MLVTIARQYAAGGSEVARLLAESLGWSLVDNDFVDQVAERAGLAPEDVAAWEERVPSFVERFARSTAMASPELFMPVTAEIEEFTESKLVKITRQLVSELAAEGRIVMVGRATPAMLAHEADCLHARMVAPRPFRIDRAIKVHGVPEKQAAHTVDERDRNRSRYLREYYDVDWADPANYDMTLNTETLGFEGAAELLVTRCRSLGWS